MSVAYLAELIFTLALGMTAARAGYDSFPRSNAVDQIRALSGSNEFFGAISAFLAATALAGGVGLAIESARGRQPASWGQGRWVWSIASVYALVSIGRCALIWPACDRETAGALRAYWAGASDSLGTLMIALWVTARIAGITESPNLDGRERAGRVLALAFIAQTAVQAVLPGWLILID